MIKNYKIHVDDDISKYTVLAEDNISLELLRSFYYPKNAINNFERFITFFSKNTKILIITQDLLNMNGHYNPKPWWNLFDLTLFSNLESLWIDQIENKYYPNIDLQNHPKMVKLWVASIKNIKNLDRSKLNYIKVWGNCKAFGTDFTNVQLPQTIERLNIRGVRSIQSLNGIEQAKNIKFLRLTLLQKLTDIQALSHLEYLEGLQIDHCDKIDYDNFPEIKSLKYLEIDNIDSNGKVSSIRFIKNLPNLEELFPGHYITDGDINPIFQSKVKKFWFFHRRHYTHTFEQVQAIRNFEMNNFTHIDWR